MATRLQTLLDGMLQDRSWHPPHQLGRRIDMLEKLERWLVHHGDTMAPSHVRRAEALMQELEAINQQLYHAIREDIRRGQGANCLLPWAVATPHDRNAESYDPLDALVSGVLDLAEPVDVADAPAGFNRVRGTIKDMAYFGSYTVYHLQLASGLALKISSGNVERHREHPLTWGDEVWASWSATSPVVLTH